MTYEGKEIAEPTLLMFVEYIKSKKFNFPAEDVYNYYKSRNWLNNKNKPVKTLESMADAWNGVLIQKSRKKLNKAKSETKSKRDLLEDHNAYGYISDVRHLGRLGYISDSTRDWIETNMLKLRSSANMYEVEFASYLINKGIGFIHQAPFIFDKKIYFADFFIPSKYVIIEIDGDYHYGQEQRKYDRFRDVCFNGHKISVIRIPNATALRSVDLDIILSEIID